MDYATSVWQIAIIALVAGAMIGALIYRLFSPSVKQANKIKADLDQTRGELANYKVSVGQHFDKTSELVNDLTQNYVRVYQHLAEGAQTLGGVKAFSNLLEQHQDKASIAIDDTTNTISDNSCFDTAVTEVSTSESVDEHAEPFSSQSGDEAASGVEATETLTEKAHGEVASETDEAKPDDKETHSATTIH